MDLLLEIQSRPVLKSWAIYVRRLFTSDSSILGRDTCLGLMSDIWSFSFLLMPLIPVKVVLFSTKAEFQSCFANIGASMILRSPLWLRKMSLFFTLYSLQPSYSRTVEWMRAQVASHWCEREKSRW